MQLSSSFLGTVVKPHEGSSLLLTSFWPKVGHMAHTVSRWGQEWPLFGLLK
jgi:hypothetical protein